MEATNRLGRTWNDFFRLSQGERREFLVVLRDWHATAHRGGRVSGGNYPYRGPGTFADLTLDNADLEPPAKPSLTDADLASLGLAE